MNLKLFLNKFNHPRNKAIVLSKTLFFFIWLRIALGCQYRCTRGSSGANPQKVGEIDGKNDSILGLQPWSVTPAILNLGYADSLQGVHNI